MIFSPIQILFGLFAIYVIARVVLKMRQRQIPKMWGLLWIIAWLALGTAALLPWTSDLLATSVGIGRGADLVVYVAIVLLLFVSFKLVLKIQRLEGEMTKLVRSLALKDIDKE